MARSKSDVLKRLKKQGKTIDVGNERILVLPLGVSGKGTKPVDSDLEEYLDSIQPNSEGASIEYYPDMDIFDYLEDN